MGCGAPVIVGNKTSLPEVVGDAGIQVDPFDVDEISFHNSESDYGSSLRALRVKGLERAKLFAARNRTSNSFGLQSRGGGIVVLASPG